MCCFNNRNNVIFLIKEKSLTVRLVLNKMVLKPKSLSWKVSGKYFYDLISLMTVQIFFCYKT